MIITYRGIQAESYDEDAEKLIIFTTPSLRHARSFIRDHQLTALPGWVLTYSIDPEKFFDLRKKKNLIQLKKATGITLFDICEEVDENFWNYITDTLSLVGYIRDDGNEYNPGVEEYTFIRGTYKPVKVQKENEMTQKEKDWKFQPKRFKYFNPVKALSDRVFYNPLANNEWDKLYEKILSSTSPR
jgi:hypothetical protein